jgi:hypothetical protein
VNIDKLLKNAQYISKIKQSKQIFEKEYVNLNENINNYDSSLHKYLNPPSLNNYKLWKYDDIVKWVISLDNGIYASYGKQLFEMLKQNQMTGEDLKDLNRTDLASFGIKVFKHRVAILKHIDNLVNGKDSSSNSQPNQNISANTNDEGEN